jgi:hypothetical protein
MRSISIHPKAAHARKPNPIAPGAATIALTIVIRAVAILPVLLPLIV